MEPGAQRANAEEFVNLYGLADAFDLGRAQVLELEIALGQSVGIGTHDRRTRRGQPLHAGRQAGRMTNRNIVGMQVVFPNGAHHDLAGIDAHPHLQIDPFVVPQPFGIGIALCLHTERGKQGALGVVFMGQRCPEEGKNTVAHGLGHIAFVAMHRGHHELQGRVNNGARVFRVKVLDEFHRTLDIGKQRGNGFALAVNRPTRFERGLLGADTFGQVGRGLGVGGWGLGERAAW